MAKSLPPVDYTRFRDTNEVISRAGSIIFDPYEATNEIIRRLTPAETKRIVEFLQAKGFRRLSTDISHGSYALVFRINDDQVIRVVPSDREQLRPTTADMLQPITNLDLQGYHIEVLPRVHTLEEIKNDAGLAQQYNLTPDAIKQLMLHMVVDNIQQGRFFFDPSYSNIGVIRNESGTVVPIIIDPGSVILENQILPHQFRQFARRCMTLDLIPGIKGHCPSADNYLPRGDPKLISAGQECFDYFKKKPQVPKLDYAGAQADNLVERGIKDGKAKGVLDEASLQQEFETFEAQRNSLGGKTEHPVYTDALHAGVSPGEFGAAAHAVSANYPTDEENKQALATGARELVTPEKAAAKQTAVNAGDAKRDGFCDRIRRHLVRQHGVDTIQR